MLDHAVVIHHTVLTYYDDDVDKLRIYTVLKACMVNGYFALAPYCRQKHTFVVVVCWAEGKDYLAYLL